MCWSWSGARLSLRRSPAGPWSLGQVVEQRVEVRGEPRSGRHSHPVLELLGIQATLGVGLAQRADGLVALGVAEPVRVGRAGIRRRLRTRR